MSDVFSPAPAELGANAEAILTWWMTKYGLGEDNRDGAIGSLAMLVKGKGQAVPELFADFPEVETLYNNAKDAASLPPAETSAT